MWRVLLLSKPLLMALTGNFDTDWSGTLMTDKGLPVLLVWFGISRWPACYSVGWWKPIGGVWYRWCPSSDPFFIPSFFCSSRALETMAPLRYWLVKTATNLHSRWIGATQDSINMNPSLGHKRRSGSIQLTRQTLIYKVIEIRFQISEIKFIKYKNITISNDCYQYLKYDKNLGLGEYQCKEIILPLKWQYL